MESQEQLTVLCVAGERSRVDHAAARLERADPDITTLTATTVPDATDAIDGGAVDCVVSRWAMAGVDGIAVLDAVRASHPDLPFVLFAPEGSERVASDAIRAGVTEYVTGGTDVDELARRIRAAADCERSRAAPADTRTRAQARYRATFEKARDAIVVADDDGRYVDANESACELFGLTREELLGRRVAEFAPDDYDFDAAWADFEADETATGSFPLVRPDGQRRLVEYAATADVVPGEHLSVLRDVTERVRLEEALETEQHALREMYRITADRDAGFEAKLRQLLDLGRDLLDVPYGFLTEIADGTQLVVEARGDHPLLQPGETCPLSEAYCRKTLTEDELVTIQNAVTEGWSDDPAFERFDLGCYAGAEIVVDGDTYGTFCFADTAAREDPFSETERTFVELMARWASYEIEQRRSTDRLRRQNDRLEEFASMVSHDLRSPLNVARGFLDLARESGDPADFDRAADALDRMEHIISDVLYLAREGEEIGATEPVDLSAAVRASWDAVAGEDTAAQLTTGDLGDVVADDDRLRQLLENLLRNSLEHAGDDVSVRVELTDDGFAVEDDGPGIPVDARETLFERGYTTDEDGTGFGLYIVRKIANAHGWTVAATGGELGGARFEFSGVERGPAVPQ